MNVAMLIACSIVIAGPLTAAAAAQVPRWRDAPRPVAVAGMLLAFVAAVSISWMRGGSAAIELGSRLGGGSTIHIDGVTAVMLPFVTLCLLVILATVPRRCLDRRATAWFLIGAAATCALFLTAHPALIVVFAAVTVLPVWRATRDEPSGRPAARVYAWSMAVSLLCLGIGTAMMLADPPWERGSGWGGTVGGWMVAIAVLIREGIVPFQFWYPALYSASPLPVALLATVPQVGSYTAVRLLVGHADGVASELVTLAHLAPVTAVYGAALALVQRDLRRLIGYLAFSQSALVLAGLAGALPMELAGGLALWIASGLSLTGIGIVAAALEGRAGPLRLDLPQGRFWDAPALAGFFLLFALAGLGLPGTLSFVADDLIVAGSLADHLHSGILVILATVFAGIAVIRGWFGIFGGPTTVDAPRHGILMRERIGCVILLATIVGCGIVPGPLVKTLEQASATLLKHRHDSSSESNTTSRGANHP